MSVTFSSKALDAFRNIKMSDDDAIAQLDSQTRRLKQVDRYKGAFMAMFRSQVRKVLDFLKNEIEGFITKQENHGGRPRQDWSCLCRVRDCLLR